MIFLLRSVGLLACVAVGVHFFYNILHGIFQTNLLFNGFIIGMFSVGLFYMTAEFIRLFYEERHFFDNTTLPPRALLFPFQQLNKHSIITQETLSHLLESLRRRLSDRTQMAHYIASSLIFLGLLGTLWGLSETIVQISEVISHLPTSSPEDTFFSLLKEQLRKPLSGMGVAFSSSLFGLAGSLILGFIDMQLGKAQEALSYRIEGWTEHVLQHRLAIPPVGKDSLGAYLAQWIEGGTRLIRIHEQHEKRQDDLHEKLMTLAEQTNQLTELMKAQSSLLTKWVSEQTQMRHTLEALGSQMHDIAFSGNEVIKGYLNQISVTSKEMLKKAALDHTDMIQTIRQETKALGILLEHRG